MLQTGQFDAVLIAEDLRSAPVVFAETQVAQPTARRIALRSIDAPGTAPSPSYHHVLYKPVSFDELLEAICCETRTEATQQPIAAPGP